MILEISIIISPPLVIRKVVERHGRNDTRMRFARSASRPTYTFHGWAKLGGTSVCSSLSSFSGGADEGCVDPLWFTDIVYLWLDCSRQRKQERHEWKVSCSSRWKIKNRTEGEFVDSLWTLVFILLLEEEIYYKKLSREFSLLWIITF